MSNSTTNPSKETDWREVMEFFQAQMDRDRAYFDRLYKRTLSAIAIIATLVVAAFGAVGFNSLESMERQVTTRVAAEFETDRIRAIVQQVASEQASGKFEEAIRTQVSEEVGSRQAEINEKIDEATQASIARAVSDELTRVSGLAAEGHARIVLLELKISALEFDHRLRDYRRTYGPGLAAEGPE